MRRSASALATRMLLRRRASLQEADGALQQLASLTMLRTKRNSIAVTNDATVTCNLIVSGSRYQLSTTPGPYGTRGGACAIAKAVSCWSASNLRCIASWAAACSCIYTLCPSNSCLSCCTTFSMFIVVLPGVIHIPLHHLRASVRVRGNLLDRADIARLALLRASVDLHGSKRNPMP